MKSFTSRNQVFGLYGEEIATKHLLRKGFSILERNYTKRWGEIDIIATKGHTIHFIEVKSVSFGTKYRPEDMVTIKKRSRLKRTIGTYLSERYEDREDVVWQVDVVCVYIDLQNRKAKIKILPDIIV